MTTRKLYNRRIVPRICQRCGSNFFVEQYTINIGQGQCCSIQCANAIKFPPPEIRFWNNVRKTDSCWLWTASVDKDGYGKFYVNKQHIRAHTFSWMLHNNSIEKPVLKVLHKCDNPPCIRPDHLFEGTALDNNRDRCAKGRGGNGRKFTLEDANVVRYLYETDLMDISQIATKYSMGKSNVHAILSNRIWKNGTTR